jgi:isopentenyl-diphosphate delta-isomerase
MEQVILVNENDEEIGLVEKVQAHLGEGMLHRAFAAFVFNKKGELLVQRRSRKKMLWPMYWDNTCSSHPREGESYEAAGERRLLEELGFTCSLKNVDKFVYQVNFGEVGAEREVCAVPIGYYNSELQPDPEEVAEYKWVDLSELEKDIANNPHIYTPWFVIGLQRLKKRGFFEHILAL